MDATRRGRWLVLGLTLTLGTNAPVWSTAELGKGRVYLMVTNEEKTAVDPDISRARFFVDGKALTSAAVKSLLAYNAGAEPLPPSGHVVWGAPLSLFTKEPGLHRLRVEGPGLASNEARVLVVPAEAKP